MAQDHDDHDHTKCDESFGVWAEHHCYDCGELLSQDVHDECFAD